MAVVFPLPSPAAWGIASVQWGPLTNTARAKGPWTLKDVVQVYDGHMWQGVLTVVPQLESDGRALAAWLTSLQGARGTFYLGDPAAKFPLGSARTAPGAPAVKGGGQSGDALAVDGLPASASGYLLPGDYIGVPVAGVPKLHMVLETVTANGAGEATLTVWPPLRGAPADNAEVTVSDAVGVFALGQGFNPWSVRPGAVYDPLVLPVAEVVE